MQNQYKPQSIPSDFFPILSQYMLHSQLHKLKFVVKTQLYKSFHMYTSTYRRKHRSSVHISLDEQRKCFE